MWVDDSAVCSLSAIGWNTRLNAWVEVPHDRNNYRWDGDNDRWVQVPDSDSDSDSDSSSGFD
jgi:hypothetical protein